MKQGQAIYIAALNFLISGTLAFIAIYLPLVLQEKSFSLFEIGLTLSLGSLVGFFGQLFWGVFSDKFGTIRYVMLMVVAGTAVLFAGLYVSNAFILIMCFAILLRFFTTSLLPFTDLWTMNYTESAGKNFGVFRQWGSVGFVVLTLGMGVAAASFGLFSVYWMNWLVLLICALIVLKMQETARPRRAANVRKGLLLLRKRQLWLFFIAVPLISVPDNAFNSFYSIYVKELSDSDMMIAFAAVVSPICQIPFFILSSRWVKNVNIFRIFTVSAGLFTMLWAAFIYNHSLLFLILSQVGLSSAKVMFYVSGTVYMRKHIPEQFRSTGQLVFFMLLFTLSGFIGNLWAGYMLDLGFRSGLFLISMVSTLIALIIFQILSRGGEQLRT